MPSLNDSIGDLGQSYGLFDKENKWFHIQLTVNANENRYG